MDRTRQATARGLVVTEAAELRRVLAEVRDAARAGDPGRLHAARIAAQSSVAGFDQLVRAHLRWGRRDRRLVMVWLHIAGDRYFYWMDEFVEAEERAWSLLEQLPTRGCSGAALRDVRDLAHHARDVWDVAHQGEIAALTRVAGAFNELRKTDADQMGAPRTEAREFQHPDTGDERPSRTGRAPRTRPQQAERSPLVDQAELRRRIAGDASSIRIGATLSGGWPWRRATRFVLPWLEQTLHTLEQPLTAPALEILAAEWRQRRSVHCDVFTNPDWADVVIADPATRPPESGRH